MFIIAQFPVADWRSLAADHMGRLPLPEWNADEPGDVFVRGFGDVVSRNSGGVGGLLGERAFADFNRVARYRGAIEYRQNDWSQALRIRPWFRRFYFDGIVSGRFEFGFLVPDIDEYRVFEPGARNGYEIAKVGETIASIPLVVRGVDLPPVSTPLAAAGNSLCEAYVAATTRRRALMEYPIAEVSGVHVSVGPPIVFVRVSDDRPVIVGRNSRRIERGEDCDIRITSCTVGERPIQVVAQRSPYGALDETGTERTIRVLFSHLNALIYASARLARADPGRGDGIGRDRLAAFAQQTLERLEKIDPGGPEADSDTEFSAGVRAFAQAYAGRFDNLFVELERFIAEMRKPTRTRRTLGFAKDLLDIITSKIVEAMLRLAIKPEA
jgi:hypothetical protein